MTCFRLKDRQTVHQWCLENGVRYSTVWTYLDKGLSVKEACKKSLSSKGNKRANTKYFYKGKAIVDIFGKGTPAYQRVLKKVHLGVSLYDAVEMEVK